MPSLRSPQEMKIMSEHTRRVRREAIVSSVLFVAAWAAFIIYVIYMVYP